jgi:hypothetical protein
MVQRILRALDPERSDDQRHSVPLVYIAVVTSFSSASTFRLFEPMLCNLLFNVCRVQESRVLETSHKVYVQ